MNFLAHLYLSYPEEELTIGNFIADFIKNKDLPSYSQSIQNGIFLHRTIDFYTDTHPIVKKGTHRLQAAHHKYAPVVLDILYDYILANNWEKYSNQKLTDFTQEIYQILLNNLEVIPLKIRHRLPDMIANDWLVSYGRDEGLRYTFERLKKRVSRPHFLENAVESLHEHYEILEKEFNLFFPDVIQHVKMEETLLAA